MIRHLSHLRWHFSVAVQTLCGFLVFASNLWAEVVRFEVKQKTPYAAGREFSGIGSYEEWRGKVHFAISPEAAAS